MSKTCPDCHRVHAPDWVRATGRFSRDRRFRGVRTHRYFATRQEGLLAECQWWRDHDARTAADDAQVEAYFDRAYQRVLDEATETDGLLDPDQPTHTAHTDRREALTRPFAPGELTPAQIMVIRTQLGSRKP